MRSFIHSALQPAALETLAVHTNLVSFEEASTTTKTWNLKGVYRGTISSSGSAGKTYSRTTLELEAAMEGCGVQYMCYSPGCEFTGTNRVKVREHILAFHLRTGLYCVEPGCERGFKAIRTDALIDVSFQILLSSWINFFHDSYWRCFLSLISQHHIIHHMELKIYFCEWLGCGRKLEAVPFGQKSHRDRHVYEKHMRSRHQLSSSQCDWYLCAERDSNELHKLHEHVKEAHLPVTEEQKSLKEYVKEILNLNSS